MKLRTKDAKDLLEEYPYWDLDDGVMILKDRGCEAGVRLSLLPALAVEDLSNITAMQKAAMRSTPPGARLRMSTDISPANDSTIQAYLAGTTAEEPFVHQSTETRANYLESLRRAGHLTRWETVVSVCLRPQENPQKKRAKAIAEIDLEGRREAVLRVRTSLERYLSQAGFNPKPMTNQDIYETIYHYVNPGSAHIELGPYTPTHQRYPSKAVERFEGLRPPTFSAQQLVSGIDNRRPGHLVVGDVYVMMLAMHTEPDEIFPAIGNLLLGSSLDCTVTVDMTHEEQGSTIRGIKGANQYAGASAAGSSKTYVDSDQDENLSQGRALLSYLTRTGEHMYQTSAAIVLRGRDLEELRYVADMYISDLARVPGAPFKRLKQGLKEPFLQLAPFNGRRYEEFVSLVERQASYFLPVNGPWTGSSPPQAVYHTRHNTLAGVSLFDSRNPNKHTLVLGKTRLGKTFTFQYQVSEELRDTRTDARIIDRGRSWERLTNNYKGVVIPVEAGGDITINPFDLPESETRPSGEQKGFLMNLLRAMVPAKDRASEGEENAILTYAIEQAYKNARSQVETDRGDELVWLEELEPFYLTQFKNTLLDLTSIGDQPLSLAERDMATSLARRLERWCGNTPLGRFVDGPTTLPTSDARVVLYETSSFDKQPQLDAVGTMLLQNEIWKRATASKQRRMLLVIEEAWALTRNEHALEFLIEMGRRGAKEGVALCLITHSVKDVTGEGKEGLLAMSNYFLFPLENESGLLQEALDLSDVMMEEWRSLTRKKGVYNEFLFMARRDSGTDAEVLRLIVSAEDYWQLTNDAEDLAAIERLTELEGSEKRAIEKLALEGVT